MLAHILDGLVKLFHAKICNTNSPYSLQVELAFQQGGADVTRYQINLQNKPEWYAARVNRASKVSHPSLNLAFIGD